MPFLSIVIPVYNAEKYLEACFESILKQKFEDYEVILVDDGSKDGSGRICDQYQEKDNRFLAHHVSNGGPSRARNIGFKMAKGKYIFCMDNDDVIRGDEFFSKIYKKTTAENMDILLTGASYAQEKEDRVVRALTYSSIDESVSLKTGELVGRLVAAKQYETSCWTKVIKRTFLIENNYFFDESLLVEDLDWNMRMLQKAKVDILHCCDYVHYYRGESITASPDKKYKSAMDQLTTIKRWYSFYENYSGDRALKEAMLSYLCYQFFITMGMSSVMTDSQQKLIRNELKQIDGLTRYSLEKKQKLLCICYRILGYDITYYVVCRYYTTMRTRVR